MTEKQEARNNEKIQTAVTSMLKTNENMHKGTKKVKFQEIEEKVETLGKTDRPMRKPPVKKQELSKVVKYIGPLKSMTISKSHPYDEFKNLVFCVTEDVHASEVMLTLEEKCFLDRKEILENKPQIGEVIVIAKNRHFIAVVIKSYIDSRIMTNDLHKALKNFRRVVDKFKFKELSVARDHDMFN